jgi:uncharacterized protein
MLPERFRRFMPDPNTLRNHRALQWMGPMLHHPRLWHVNRRGIALGLAIGIFFGLLMPVAQILFAAGGALLLRANIPAAVGSTLVTNPITFAPLYYAAYHLGAWMLGHANVPVTEVDLDHVAARTATGLALWMDRLATVGAPAGAGPADARDLSVGGDVFCGALGLAAAHRACLAASPCAPRRAALVHRLRAYDRGFCAAW